VSREAFLPNGGIMRLSSTESFCRDLKTGDARRSFAFARWVAWLWPSCEEGDSGLIQLWGRDVVVSEVVDQGKRSPARTDPDASSIWAPQSTTSQQATLSEGLRFAIGLAYAGVYPSSMRERRIVPRAAFAKRFS